MGKLGTTDRELFRQHYTDIQNMEYVRIKNAYFHQLTVLKLKIFFSW